MQDTLSSVLRGQCQIWTRADLPIAAFLFFARRLCSEFLAGRIDEWGNGNVHVCEYDCEDGGMSWADWGDEEGEEFGVVWDGMEACQSGTTIGMMLNLYDGTLAVYKNNRRLGVMKDGLSGSYCWYVTVAEESAFTIKRGEPPRV